LVRGLIRADSDRELPKVVLALHPARRLARNADSRGDQRQKNPQHNGYDQKLQNRESGIGMRRLVTVTLLVVHGEPFTWATLTGVSAKSRACSQSYYDRPTRSQYRRDLQINSREVKFIGDEVWGSRLRFSGPVGFPADPATF
jgi:hypothetical protein